MVLGLARGSLVLLGLAIPVSVVLDNLLLFVLLLLMPFAGIRELAALAKNNPVARSASLLFGALAIGMVYGEGSLAEAVATLGKYADLAFVPLFMLVARDESVRYRAAQIFIAVMMLTAALSWLVGMHVLPLYGWMWVGATPDNPPIFRGPITQNVLMAYAGYLILLRMRIHADKRMRWGYGALAALSLGSVLFLVQGRTGYLVLLALLLYFVWVIWRQSQSGTGRNASWRRAAGMSLLALFLVVGVYQASPRLHERMDKVVTEFKAWQPGESQRTSTGERMEFYYHSLALVKQHPWLGVGTGGFHSAYEQQVQGNDAQLTGNPHNEYLLITVQLGLGGLLLLLYLFYTQWRYAVNLPTLFEQDAARGLVLTISITALFNSPLLDHTEGLFSAFASALLFANLRVGKRDA